jgi:NAD(P)-dependent dehydrogenase (short-subunit alcohol dehydrogenase family)
MGNASLMSFTVALGAASPEHGVRVLGVNPGPVLTDRVVKISRKRAQQLLGDEERYTELLKKNPFGRPASVDEIAASVVFLASDLASYTSGTIVTIDGGFSKRPAV